MNSNADYAFSCRLRISRDVSMFGIPDVDPDASADEDKESEGRYGEEGSDLEVVSQTGEDPDPVRSPAYMLYRDLTDGIG